MSTIQGSISKLVDNSNMMFHSMGYVSSSMANWNTTAYKAERFETFFGPYGVMRGTARVDATAGDHMTTFRQLDVAIEGAGYIPITNEKGETLYTRDGSFAINSEGYIVSKNNSIVGSGIKVPANYHRIKIKPEGDVLLQIKPDEEFKEIGKIPVVAFQNPEALNAKEGNMFQATEKSGKPELLLGHTKVKQGKLEAANINRLGLVNETLKLNGGIISSTRVIKMLDEMYKESINLRQ